MSGPIPKENIAKACVSGIKSAQKQYENMSGDWVYWAPEYFITSCIAQKLHQQKGNKYITIENSAYEALNEAGAIGRGRLHRDIRSNGRFDIILWWAKGDPRAVIEIKNRVFNRTQYEPDLKRIMGVLSRKSLKSSIQFGIFAFYMAANQSKKKSAMNIMQQRLLTIEANVSEILGRDFKYKVFFKSDHDNESAWYAVSLLIEHNQRG